MAASSAPDISSDRARLGSHQGPRDGKTVGYFAQWAHVLDSGLDAVVDVVVSPTGRACELRQNSPFAGVLLDETRLKVLRSLKEHWTREHEPIPA